MTSPFDIRNALEAVQQYGIIRPNKFLVTTTMPSVLSGSSFNSILNQGGMLSVWAESATIPGAMLDMTAVRRYGYGPMENKPWQAHFTDVQMLFRSDAQGLLHGFLHQWMQSAVNYNYNDAMNDSAQPGTSGSQSWEVNYKDDFVTTVAISVFDDQAGLNSQIQTGVGEGDIQALGTSPAVMPAIQIFLRDAFPVAVGDVPLSWGARGEYIKFPVQFSFFSWYSARTPAFLGGQQGTNQNFGSLAS